MHRRRETGLGMVEVIVIAAIVVLSGVLVWTLWSRTVPSSGDEPSATANQSAADEPELAEQDYGALYVALTGSAADKMEAALSGQGAITCEYTLTDAQSGGSYGLLAAPPSGMTVSVRGDKKKVVTHEAMVTNKAASLDDLVVAVGDYHQLYADYMLDDGSVVPVVYTWDETESWGDVEPVREGERFEDGFGAMIRGDGSRLVATLTYCGAAERASFELPEGVTFEEG